MSVFVQMISSNWLNFCFFVFTKLVMVRHHHEPKCHAKRLICYFPGQGQSKDLYDQTHTVSTISFELLNCYHFPRKLGLIVHYHKPECLKKKLDYFV